MTRIITLATTFLLFCSSNALSKRLVLIENVSFQSSTVDTTLNINEAKYEFVLANITPAQNQFIEYKLDGVQFNSQLGINQTISIQTTPGKHVFEFYVNRSYSRLVTDTLSIQNQHIDQYRVVFSQSFIREEQFKVISLKPVIYLYPESKIDVEVKLNFVGENPILYPEYNDGWKCSASPNGDLKIGNDTFNYLFWEATQPDHLRTANQKEGFIVKGNESISFLEEKLTLAGFTSKEKADFITFWGPLIQKNDLNFVRFEFNEVCDKFTELEISPKPDNVYRLYIFFSPIKEVFEVAKQEIEPMNREGFTVLEWGGQISLPIKTTNINL